ncbi:MAG: cobyric acid synthase CobQ, partial [Pseudomonadota bacterium]|nr:cobyric acid synthase CobQ [Pseudomonadota bacterium]
DVETVLEGDKTVRNVSAELAGEDTVLEGYEIHMGRTSGPDCARPFATVAGRPYGAVSVDGRTRGSYLHGLFGSDAFRARLLDRLGAPAGSHRHRDQVEAALDALADHIEAHLDVGALLGAAADVDCLRVGSG